MICKQLSEATQALVQLRPHPSLLDITRVVCGSCKRMEQCPCFSFDHFDFLDRGELIRKPSSEDVVSERVSGKTLKDFGL